MEDEIEVDSSPASKTSPFYRALWVALSEIDRCKDEQDRSEYNFRTRQTQIASLQALCEQHNLQRFGGTDHLHDLTGDKLWQALSNQWYRLRKRENDKEFQNLFKHGTASCLRVRLDEYKKCHDAFVQGQDLLPREKNTASKRVIVEIPAPKSGHEHNNMGLASIDRSDHKDKANQISTPRGPTRNLRKRKRSASIDAPEETPALSARRSNINIDFVSIPSEPLAFDSIKQEFMAIYDVLHQSVLSLSSNHRLDKCQAVVSPEPHHFLLPLYKRCWGEDWRFGADSLLAERNRSVEDDTLALVSAFLLESILLRTGLCKPNANRVNGPEHENTKSADDNDNDEKSTSHLLQAALFAVQVESLTAQLTNALTPYIDGLTQLSHLMHASRIEGDADAIQKPILHRDLSHAVEKALKLRVRLDDSKYKAEFLWPQRGQIFDPIQIQIPYEQDDNPAVRYTVAFTKFPGIKLQHLRQQITEKEVAYKACVVLRAEAAEQNMGSALMRRGSDRSSSCI